MKKINIPKYGRPIDVIKKNGLDDYDRKIFFKLLKMFVDLLKDIKSNYPETSQN